MVDSDGKTHLDKPYCALQKECFGGIVGAKSPYADGLGLMGEFFTQRNWDFFPQFIIYVLFGPLASSTYLLNVLE